MVLIGFARYGHAPDLPAVDNNLDALQEFFTSTSGWGLPGEHCHVIRQAAAPDDLITPLRSAATAARDTLLVYYAGHGILDEDMEFSLSLPGSRLDEPWTGVSYTWVKRFIARARAKRRLAVLDSCFSGKAHAVMGSTSEAVKGQAAAAGTTVITSARDDRVALAPAGETYTAFTGELLTVLREGMDGGPAVLTVDQVYECVKQALAAKGRPRPDRTGSDTCGHTVMAVNRAFVPVAATAEPHALAHQHLRRWVARLQEGHKEAADSPPVTASSTETGTVIAAEGTQPGGALARNSRPAEPNSPPDAGKIFANGRYETIAMVGIGGMAEVYLCRDTLLGRTIIAKRVRTDQSGLGPDHLRDEARAVAALNHPSIAAVYDVVQEAAGQYLIMEYVPGWELGVAAAARPTVQEILAAAMDVLDGLEHSHAAGIIHCDIKPANLVLTTQGRVKILDFGISSINESIHKIGGSAGTLRYMPPEAFAGEPPHVARDIFSVGATLGELITGRQNNYPTSHFGPPRLSPPSELVPDLDPGVEALIEKAMALNPGERFSSAAQMRAEIERYM
ncbi:caspase, EACC1-associated type [Streptomyces aureus]